MCCELLKGGAVAGGLGFEDFGCAVLVSGEEVGEGFWGEGVGDLPRFGREMGVDGGPDGVVGELVVCGSGVSGCVSRCGCGVGRGCGGLCGRGRGVGLRWSCVGGVCGGVGGCGVSVGVGVGGVAIGRLGFGSGVWVGVGRC